VSDAQPAVSGDVIDLEQLIVMANQIGDFFAPYHIDAGGDGLDTRVIEAAEQLRDKAADKSGYYGPPQA
jgi:hypothetical protein